MCTSKFFKCLFKLISIDGMFQRPQLPPGHPPGTVISDKCIILPILRGGLGGLQLNSLYYSTLQIAENKLNRNFIVNKCVFYPLPSLPPLPPLPPPPPPQKLRLPVDAPAPSGFVNGSISDRKLK